MLIFTRAWWEAAGTRMADTALAVLLPLVFLLVAGDVAPVHVISLVAVQVLAVLATSLAGLPEVAGKSVSLWRAVVVRTAKTLGQSIATALVGVELIEAVDWSAAWVLIAGATLYTLLRTLRDWLPETLPALADDVKVTIHDVGGTISYPGWSSHDPTGIPGFVVPTALRTEGGRHVAALEDHADAQAAGNDRDAFPYV